MHPMRSLVAFTLGCLGVAQGACSYPFDDALESGSGGKTSAAGGLPAAAGGTTSSSGCVEPVADCGREGTPCCNCGPSCGDLLVCDSSGSCVACGGQGKSCCGSACDPGLTCAGGACVTCGTATSDPCCGMTCGAGLICAGGACQPCGGYDEPCCAENACDNGDLSCRLAADGSRRCLRCCAECVAIGWEQAFPSAFNGNCFEAAKSRCSKRHTCSSKPDKCCPSCRKSHTWGRCEAKDL